MLAQQAQDAVLGSTHAFETQPRPDLAVPFPSEEGLCQQLANLGDQVEAVCRSHAKGCEVNVRETLRSEPATFSPDIVSSVAAAAGRLGLPHMDIASGATHDAKFMVGRCPTGMIFIPCRNGLSHVEEEEASPEHVAVGAGVLSEILVELANNAD